MLSVSYVFVLPIFDRTHTRSMQAVHSINFMYIRFCQSSIEHVTRSKRTKPRDATDIPQRFAGGEKYPLSLAMRPQERETREETVQGEQQHPPRVPQMRVPSLIGSKGSVVSEQEKGRDTARGGGGVPDKHQAVFAARTIFLINLWRALQSLGVAAGCTAVTMLRFSRQQKCTRTLYCNDHLRAVGQNGTFSLSCFSTKHIYLQLSLLVCVHQLEKVLVMLPPNRTHQRLTAQMFRIGSRRLPVPRRQLRATVVRQPVTLAATAKGTRATKATRATRATTRATEDTKDMRGMRDTGTTGTTTRASAMDGRPCRAPVQVPPLAVVVPVHRPRPLLALLLEALQLVAAVA